MVQRELEASPSSAESVDDYRLIRPLGRRRPTYLAHDRILDRAVVVSFLPEASDERAAGLAIARAFARVSHPNLGRVHRVQEGATRPYVVAAFARGEPIDASAAPLPDERALHVARALAGALAALHAAGVAHGDVRAGRVVVSDEGAPCLVGFARAHVHADAAAKRADVTALLGLLGTIAGGDLRARLSSLAEVGRGDATADDLCRALDAIGRPALSHEALAENPYRGLRAFDGEHTSAFFGRAGEIAELAERLRAQPGGRVAGRSGTGKSSLARAGVAPAIARGALGECAGWDVATMVPGVRPLTALARALAPFVDRDPGELAAALRTKPALAARLVRARTERGLLLVVDQLEEAFTLADAEEREAFCGALDRFGAISPGVRVVFTLRSDFLGRLVDEGAFGRDVIRAAYVLPAMSAEGLREAIVQPARAHGFELETPAIADALVAEVSSKDEALPLLSFALAELWGRRDGARHVIPEAALGELGGAVAAIARHGDLVLATLRDDERGEARRILLALVTASETRARRTSEDLVGAGGLPARAALEALVRGRLVVAGETCEIAHEALARAWPLLRAWLDEASDGRAAAARLAVAAREWVRLGRGEVGLGGESLLRDLEIPGALEGASPEARAFVDASRAAVRRARLRRWAVRVGAPAGTILLVAAIVGGVRWSERRQAHAFVAARLAEAEPLAREVSALEAQVQTERTEAFTRYDADDTPGGEAHWHAALALARRESDAFAAASAPLGLALARDPLDRVARARTADLVYSWLLAAERDREPDVARDLTARLAQLDDDGSRRARLAATARLHVTTTPPGARVVLHDVHVDAEGRRVEDAGRPIDLATAIELAPGSYVLEATAPGRYATRFPVLLGRNQEEAVEIPLPVAAAVPPGFIFVPAGVSLLGAADVEAVRDSVLAEPQHPVKVHAFLIGEHEVTYAEYLEFLATLPPAEREARRPNASNIDLTFDRDDVPVLQLGAATARRGDPLCRPKRGVRRCQDWLRLPVVGVRWEEGQAYVAWLASGRVRGARFCSEREWERAARGADGRIFAHGDAMHPGDANFDASYAVDEDLMGADEVGSFPIDRSPFGALDLGGNVSEWAGFGGPVRAARGGHWLTGALECRSSFRSVVPNGHYWILGMRVCASAPTE